jgi:hypothetical protein
MKRQRVLRRFRDRAHEIGEPEAAYAELIADDEDGHSSEEPMVVLVFQLKDLRAIVMQLEIELAERSLPGTLH